MKYKKKEYLPTIDWSKATVLYGRDARGKVREKLVGPVLKRGLNLPGDRKLADYIDLNNYMFDTTKFFLDHKGRFPDLWILVQGFWCSARLLFRMSRLGVSASGSATQERQITLPIPMQAQGTRGIPQVLA